MAPSPIAGIHPARQLSARDTADTGAYKLRRPPTHSAVSCDLSDGLLGVPGPRAPRVSLVEGGCNRNIDVFLGFPSPEPRPPVRRVASFRSVRASDTLEYTYSPH